MGTLQSSPKKKEDLRMVRDVDHHGKALIGEWGFMGDFAEPEGNVLGKVEEINM
jgi:hypothetical protein